MISKMTYDVSSGTSSDQPVLDSGIGLAHVLVLSVEVTVRF